LGWSRSGAEGSPGLRPGALTPADVHHAAPGHALSGTDRSSGDALPAPRRPPPRPAHPSRGSTISRRTPWPKSPRPIGMGGAGSRSTTNRLIRRTRSIYRLLPGSADMCGQRSGEAELGVGDEQEPGPAGPPPREHGSSGWSIRASFCEPETCAPGRIESPQEPPPPAVHIRRGGAGLRGPEAHRWRLPLLR
jgi:hypothetical protein